MAILFARCTACVSLLLLALPASARPFCEKSESFGTWRAYATDISGEVVASSTKKSENVRRANFKYYFGLPSGQDSYTLDIRMKGATALKTFDILVTAGGTSNKVNMAPTRQNAQAGNAVIAFEVGDLFRIGKNPLGVTLTTIEISSAGTQLVSFELKPAGFSEAMQFLRTEQPRLLAMREKKECTEETW